MSIKPEFQTGKTGQTGLGTGLTGLETGGGPEENHVMVALLAEVRFCNPVLLEVQLFLFATETAGQVTGHRHLELLAEFSRDR